MSTRIPKVAISSVPRPVQTGYGTDTADTVAKGAIAGIVASGGVPVVLPVVAPELAAAQLEGVKGLILSGGHDLALPLEGDGPAVTEERWIDPDRDRHELALWGAAKARGLPVLGICRGAQLVNHAEGGTIVAHVIGHDSGADQAEELHEVKVEADTLLAGICGAGTLNVNTIHHQAVGRPGAGLAASARANDGLVEAIEATEGAWFVGVQWHPELMLTSPAGQPLFDAVAARARG
jgi:putative glutamine amidotransferase